MEELVKEIYEDDDNIEVNLEDNSLKVQTIEEATRYAYGLSKTREEIAKLEEIAQAEIEKWQKRIDQVNEWLESVTKPLKQKEEYLANQLRMFHIVQYNNAKTDKERNKLKSIKLPYDITLKSREQQPEYKIVDEEAYKTYAQDHDLLKPPKEPEVNWSEFKKKIKVNNDQAIDKETGEVLNFIKVIPKGRKFEVN